MITSVRYDLCDFSAHYQYNATINCNPQYPQYGIHRGIIGGLYRGSPTKLPPVVGLLTQAFL